MEECKKCQIRSVDLLVKRFSPDIELEKTFKDQANIIIENNKDNSPLLATKINRLASDLFQCNDIYKKEKAFANNLLLTHFDYWKKIVGSGELAFNKALKLAVVGNIIDYGAHSVPDDILAHVKELYRREFAVDDSERLYQDILNAKSILYLGDNAGEIVFDRLLIENIKHKNITFAVRGNAVINDVTVNDASEVKMHQLCKVIDNGFDAPSTILDYCNESFKEKFNEADLIISKGQGNFEGLMNCGKTNICFLLMAKCNYIADKLGVTKGDLVVKYLNN
ncbi:MAG: DUF89 domain-containing protein [Hyphomicrobiales bacterium]